MDNIHNLINYKPYYNDSFSYSLTNHDQRELMKKKKKKKGSLGYEKRVVKLSTDPQSVAARERRQRISEKLKILESMVPAAGAGAGGMKMDTASMLEEAIHYVKLLKTQIWLHQAMINFHVDGHHHLLASDDHHQLHYNHFSQENNDYLLTSSRMYGHDGQHAMSFDTSINYN